MLSLIKNHPRAFVFALLVHLLLVAVMTLSVQWTDTRKSRKPQVSVVEAVAVDEREVAKELKRIKVAEQKKQRQLQRELQRARKARKKEEKRLAALKRKQAQEKKSEQKRLAKLKQEREALQQKRQREEQQLQQAREKRQQEEQELRRLDQKRKEEELRRKLVAEQQRLAQQKQSERQATIDRYRVMIEAEVRKHWPIPPGAKAGMACILRVRLLPSGEVIRVEVVQSSGNRVFDQSVQDAVRKASPLPVPSVSSGLFDMFRDLRFPFKLEKK